MKTKIQKGKLWGEQTELSKMNFRIGPQASMPLEIIYAYAHIKKAAAYANFELGDLSEEKRDLIGKVCNEILDGELDDQFPLVIWQTGSGTQTNMNVNEVISNRAKSLSSKKASPKTFIHPNDDVNKSQSSNDTFSTAMHIAAYNILINKTIPNLEILKDTLLAKSIEFQSITKIGRTHLMDATPITLGQEFSGYVSQLEFGISALKNTLNHLTHLAIGGTAVGTGINTFVGYDKLACNYLNKFTGHPFILSKNKFEGISTHDAFVESHGSLKQIAVSLNKIANDIKLLSSGPKTGIGEIIIPQNEPGSSIMPGKFNPTQAEALTMVCAQVIGNDVTINVGGMQGQLELNTYKPVIIANFLQSAELIGDASISFAKNCIKGIIPDLVRIDNLLNSSLSLITALNNKIGYEKAAEIAKAAYVNGTTLKEEALRLGYVSTIQFEKWLDPKKMTHPLKK